MSSQRLVALVFAVLPASAAAAQQPIVERPIGAVIAATQPGLVPFGTNVFRVLSNGSIVTGGTSVRLIDSSLTTATVVMDTASELPPSMPMGIVLPDANMRMPARRYAIAPHSADSTIVIASGEVSLTLIGPTGAIGRAFAMPFGTFPTLIETAGSSPTIDSRGRLVVRGAAAVIRGAGGVPVAADSSPLIRITLANRAIDTLARVRTDDPWGVLSDGTLLIIRSNCALESITVDGQRQRIVVQGCAPARQSTTAELPDARPVYRGGNMIADRAGDLWVERDISPEERRTSGDLYDVIDGQGGVVDRVRIASRAQIIGFTADRIYLRVQGGIEIRGLR